MECYNVNCKRECDKYKKMYCLFRETKEIYNYKQKIRKIKLGTCEKCGKLTIRGRLKRSQENIILCTECKELIKIGEV